MMHTSYSQNISGLECRCEKQYMATQWLQKPALIVSLGMERPFSCFCSTNSRNFLSGIAIPLVRPTNYIMGWISCINKSLFFPASYILVHNREFPCCGTVAGFSCMLVYHWFKIGIITATQWFWYCRCWCTFPYNAVIHDFVRTFQLW